MTTNHCDSRNKRMINNIQAVLRVHQRLCQYAAALQVTVENAVIVVSGELPSTDLKSEVVPAVRQAGVMGQVCDCVHVTS